MAKRLAGVSELFQKEYFHINVTVSLISISYFIVIKNYFLSFCSFPNLSLTSAIESLLDLDPNTKGLVSSIYTLISYINPQMLDHLKEAWEQYLEGILRG